MKHKVTHFAIHTDDLKRAANFYQNLFGWQFRDYGPDDFKQIFTGDEEHAELIGALQSRRYSPIDTPIKWLEGTVLVEVIDVIK